jgi:hypothetical protein
MDAKHGAFAVFELVDDLEVGWVLCIGCPSPVTTFKMWDKIWNFNVNLKKIMMKLLIEFLS